MGTPLAVQSISMSPNPRVRRNVETLVSLALAFLLSMGIATAAGAGVLSWWVAAPCLCLAALGVVLVSFRLSGYEIGMRWVDLILENVRGALSPDASEEELHDALRGIRELYTPYGPLYQIEAYDEGDPPLHTREAQS